MLARLCVLNQRHAVGAGAKNRASFPLNLFSAASFQSVVDSLVRHAHLAQTSVSTSPWELAIPTKVSIPANRAKDFVFLLGSIFKNSRIACWAILEFFNSGIVFGECLFKMLSLTDCPNSDSFTFSEAPFFGAFCTFKIYLVRLDLVLTQVIQSLSSYCMPTTHFSSRRSVRFFRIYHARLFRFNYLTDIDYRNLCLFNYSGLFFNVEV